MGSLTQKDLIERFISGDIEGVCGGGKNLRIDKDQLIHYQTVIAERYGDKFILNMTRYSLPTGRIQKMLCEQLKENELWIVKAIPIGYKKSLSAKIIEKID